MLLKSEFLSKKISSYSHKLSKVTDTVRPTFSAITRKAAAVSQSVPENVKLAPVATVLTLIAVFFILPGVSPVSAFAPTTTEASGDPSTQSLVVSEAASQGQTAIRDSYYVTKPPPETSATSYASIASTFENNVDSSIQWPFLVGVPITDTFGAREAPCENCSTFHRGVDFTPGAGSQIQTIAAGVVTEVHNSAASSLEDKSGSYGTYVVIQHNIDGQTVESLYAHLAYQSSPLAIGQQVRVGQLVGVVGNTGQSTGPHLHLEIRINGTAVDPIAWLKAHN